jgi:hypothetical protein
VPFSLGIYDLGLGLDGGLGLSFATIQYLRPTRRLTGPQHAFGTPSGVLSTPVALAGPQHAYHHPFAASPRSPTFKGPHQLATLSDIQGLSPTRHALRHSRALTNSPRSPTSKGSHHSLTPHDGRIRDSEETQGGSIGVGDRRTKDTKTSRKGDFQVFFLFSLLVSRSGPLSLSALWIQPQRRAR